MLIAIDPGYAARDRGCAVAVFGADAQLSRVYFARPESVSYHDMMRDQATRVVWECPQVDARTRHATPEAVQLAAVGGTLAGMFAGLLGVRAEPVTPSMWKGSLPKPVQHKRSWAVLSEDERALLGGALTAEAIAKACTKGALDRWSRPGVSYYPRGWLVHNTLDAVGLGLWALERSA